MNCQYYREQVSAFVDNELESSSQTALFDHLSECMECHLFLDSLMKFKSLKHREEEEFPHEIDEALFDEVHRRKYIYTLGKRGLEVKVPLWQRRVALPVPALAAMIVALVLGVSTLFVNLLAEVKPSPPGPVQNAATERVVEKRETIVYGVPGVTIYGQQARTERTGL